LGGSHEHNLLPFSTPKSYALLSVESKATEAANNKEMLDRMPLYVWCRTILRFRGAVYIRIALIYNTFLVIARANRPNKQGEATLSIHFTFL
jgi:hypothetical protein